MKIRKDIGVLVVSGMKNGMKNENVQFLKLEDWAYHNKIKSLSIPVSSSVEEELLKVNAFTSYVN